MLARTLNISVGSVAPTNTLNRIASISPRYLQTSWFFRLSQLSAPEAAAILDRLIPEAFEGDNIRLASSLTCPRATVGLEVFKLIIFELSNNSDHWVFSNEDEKIPNMGLFSSLSLTKPTVLNEVFQRAPNEPSLLAAVHTLFRLACFGKYDELLLTMIKCDKKIHNGVHVCIQPPHLIEAFDMAMELRNEKLIGLLLSPENQHLIQEAFHDGYLARQLAHLLLDESESSTTIIKMMLLSGIKFQFHRDQLLDLITDGYFEVLLLPTDYRADLDDEVTAALQICNDYPLITVDTVDATVAAVAFSCNECGLRRFDGPAMNRNLRNRCGDCEARALKMLHEVRLRKARADNGISTVPLNVLIIAAARGFNEIIHTFAGDHEGLNWANKDGLWPLCAAVVFNHLDTCRLLLQLGACPNYRPPTPESGSCWMLPLHEAALANYVSIAQILLKASAHIDQRDALTARELPYVGLKENYSLCRTLLITTRSSNPA